MDNRLQETSRPVGGPCQWPGPAFLGCWAGTPTPGEPLVRPRNAQPLRTGIVNPMKSLRALVSLSLALLAYASQTSAGASTVVVLNEGHRVLVATDSLARNVRDPSLSRQQCKISILSNQQIFTATGVRSTSSGLDVHRIARETCLSGMSLYDCVVAYQRAIVYRYASSSMTA